MKFRIILSVCMGFLLSCTAMFMSFAHAEDYVTKSQINAANGVAGLNASKQVTADVNNAQVKITNQYHLSNGSIISRPLIKMVPDNNSGMTLGKEAVQFGGDYTYFPNSNSQGGATTRVAMPRSLSVIGRPYGNYNAGCTLCVFSTSSGMFEGGAQAALSGVDYHGGANAVANGDLATAGFYQFEENSPARVISQVQSFGPGVVTLSSPMTDAQMSQLHDGMYIATNVTDPTLASNEHLLKARVYWGFIKSWDSTHIYVYDWAVPGSGNITSGQVPNIQNLDTTLSMYKVPMIFAGISNKIFAKNTYMNVDGSRVLGDKATSVANEFEREEFDFRAHDWTKPKSLSFHGWTTSFECRPNCDPKAVSDDSYAYLVNGSDGLPRAYVAQTVGDALEFSGYSTFIGGSSAPLQVDDQGNTSIGGQGSNHIMSSFESHLPSNNNVHMSTIIDRESTASNDWRDYGVRLVMDVDSQRDRKKGLYNGSRMGSIAFNYNAAHYGGICLLGNDVNQGLCQEGDGSVSFAKQIHAEGQAFFQNGIFTAAADYDPTQKSVNGQGAMQTWNMYYPGNAHTEFTNIDPTNSYGGFDFYNIQTTSSIQNAQPLVRFGVRDSFFDIYPTMKQGLSVSAGKKILFQNNNDFKGVYLTIDSSNYTNKDQAAGKPDTRGDLLIGSEVADGANIRGVNGYYGKSLTVTQQVSAVGFKGKLSTPSSSSASCTTGEFKDDANYHYVCVVANKWKRVALSDF